MDPPQDKPAHSALPAMKFDFSYQKQPLIERTVGVAAQANSVSPRVHQLATMSPRVRGRNFVEASSSSAFPMGATVPGADPTSSEEDGLFSFDADDLQRFDLPAPQKSARFLTTANTEHSASVPASLRPLPPSHPRSSASGKGSKKLKTYNAGTISGVGVWHVRGKGWWSVYTLIARCLRFNTLLRMFIVNLQVHSRRKTHMNLLWDQCRLACTPPRLPCRQTRKMRARMR
jgi:hypothetical protein